MKKHKHRDITEFDLSSLNERERNYIKDRIISQIQWYSSKSATMKKRYKILSILSTGISVSIPILTLIKYKHTNILIASAGTLVTFLNFIMGLNQYKELWISYRTNGELLRSKLHMFLHSNQYDNDNFTNFVADCETVMMGEYVNWKASTEENQLSTSSSTSS